MLNTTICEGQMARGLMFFLMNKAGRIEIRVEIDRLQGTEGQVGKRN